MARLWLASQRTDSSTRIGTQGSVDFQSMRAAACQACSWHIRPAGTRKAPSCAHKRHLVRGDGLSNVTVASNVSPLRGSS
jgi:hypothetical protein